MIQDLEGRVALVTGGSRGIGRAIDVGAEVFGGIVPVVVGAFALALIPRARATKIDRDDLPKVLVLAAIWVAIPFTLFPIAQQWIDSAIAGMLNGAMPILTAIVATALPTIVGELGGLAATTWIASGARRWSSSVPVCRRTRRPWPPREGADAM